MSELDTLAHELRTMANKLRRVLLNNGVCYMETLDTLYLSMEDMREAADTIEGLRDRLQEAGDQACHATQPNYEHCKYSTNRGWCDDAPFIVWDDTGHLFITMGGLKTWDVTDDVKKWFAELDNGTLTAEQVRETVEKHWHDLPADYDMPEATALPEYSYDWQAIADELNATLGCGECECVWNEQEGTFHCSSCDTLLTNEISIEWPSHKVTPITLPNYCRNCGKAVKR